MYLIRARYLAEAIFIADNVMFLKRVAADLWKKAKRLPNSLLNSTPESNDALIGPKRRYGDAE